MRRFKIIERSEHFKDYIFARGCSFRTGEVVIRWIGEMSHIELCDSMIDAVDNMKSMEKKLDIEFELVFVWIDKEHED